MQSLTPFCRHIGRKIGHGAADSRTCYQKRGSDCQYPLFSFHILPPPLLRLIVSGIIPGPDTVLIL